MASKERTTVELRNGELYHVIDNTDTRALSENRFRYVFPNATDQQVKDFLDVFYGLKGGNLVFPV